MHRAAQDHRAAIDTLMKAAGAEGLKARVQALNTAKASGKGTALTFEPAMAEGIETDEQAKLVLAAGCSRGQGYLFGKPKPMEAILSQMQSPGAIRAA